MAKDKQNMDAELLQELNAKFEVFTEQVLRKLDSILELKEVVSRLSESKQHKREREAERKRAQRTRDREQREKGLLPLPRDIWRRDERIKLKYLQWAHVGLQFGMAGEWRTFCQYLAHEWNVCTYNKKPIAKCSNYPHWWDNGIRHDYTWCDMFGSERGIVPKTAPEIKWWDWGFHMLAVVQRMENLPDWPNVNKQFLQAMQVAMGDMAGASESGELTVRGVEFRCREAQCFEKVDQFRYLALHVLQAFKRGICKAVDDDLELIRVGKVRFLEHCVQLEKAATHMRFHWKLRKGNMTTEQMNQSHDLCDLGFFEFPAAEPKPDEEKTPDVKVV